MQVNRKIRTSTLAKNYLFTSYLAAKHQKHSKSRLTDIREKPVDSFCHIAPALTLVPAIILLT